MRRRVPDCYRSAPLIVKLQNAMVWGSVLLYVLLLLGSVYFLLSSSRQPARVV